MMRGWQVEHTCPQCGAPVVLNEEDHWCRCEYCRVYFSLVSREAHRYVLPPPKPVPNLDPVYVPYWRFRGAVYACVSWKIIHRLLDSTIRAGGDDPVPISLGLRPQVMKLKFMEKETAGRFLDPGVTFKESLDLMQQRLKVKDPLAPIEPPWYSAFFGETVSLIYAPFYFDRNKVYDGVLNKLLGPWPGGDFENARTADKVDWEVRFLPALCPNCGWDLSGDKNSLIQVCRNCLTASETTRTGLKTIRYTIMPSPKPDPVYLPFWRMDVNASGAVLDTYADLVQVANMPRAVRPEDHERKLFFWAPAFKPHPQLFLRLARNLTVSQPDLEHDDGFRLKHLKPATLSVNDAVGGVKTILSHITQAKRSLFPQLPDIDITLDSYDLVYIPFHPLGRELVNEKMYLTVQPELFE